MVKHSSHFVIWFFVLIASIPLSMLLNYSIIEHEVMKERQQVEMVFGSEREQVVLQRSVASYSFCCADVAKSLDDYFLAGEDNAIDNTFKMILESVWGSVFQALLRMHVFVEWLTWLWPVIVFFIVDGFVRRRIRAESLTTSNVNRFFISKHGVVLSIGLSVAYMFFPFSASIVAIPAILILFTYSLHASIVQLHRMF